MYSNMLGNVEDTYQVMLSAIMEKKVENIPERTKRDDSTANECNAGRAV